MKKTIENHVMHLVHLSESFLDRDDFDENFPEDFEGYFFDHEAVIYENEDYYTPLDKIREAINYYQPDPNVRKGQESLLDEDQLKKAVKENIYKLKMFLP